MVCKVSLLTWPQHNANCRKWDISGIPCVHAITCIFFNRQDAELYVHPCHHVSTYKACYEPIISPINGQNMWRPSGVTPVQSPIKRRPPGKPKKKRVKEPNEPTSRKDGISKQCKAYGKVRHNRSCCKGEIEGNSSLLGTTNKTNTSNKVIYGHVCEIVAFQYSILMCVNFLFVDQQNQNQGSFNHTICTIPG